MPLTPSDVEHIADLARLELTAQEKELYATQLSSILEYVGKLSEVDTSGIQYGYQVDGLENAMDADEVKPCDSDTRSRLLSAMPDRAGDLLKVRRVFGE